MTRLRIVRVVRSVGCRSDDHCAEGWYCEQALLTCRRGARPCVSCAALRRAPANNTSCVTHPAGCGVCLAGLVPSSANGNYSCGPPPAGAAPAPFPYEWVAGLLLAALICAAAVWLLRNFHTFKIFTVSIPVDADVEASAPPPPPPPSYAAATSPGGGGAGQADRPAHDHEAVPFIKPVLCEDGGGGGGRRESAGTQNARVYNTPAYLRPLRPPCSEPVGHQHPEMLPIIREVETETSSPQDNNSLHAPECPVPVAEAVAPEVPAETHAPAAKDRNNNERGSPRAAPHPASPLVSNVIVNVSTDILLLNDNK